MTTIEKKTLVQSLVGQGTLDDTLLTNYLNLAEDKINNKLYPFGVPNGYSMPTQYDYLQCELAARLILKRGAEGEVIHNVDGVNRTYASVDEEDLLKRVVPFARVNG